MNQRWDQADEPPPTPNLNIHEVTTDCPVQGSYIPDERGNWWDDRLHGETVAQEGEDSSFYGTSSAKNFIRPPWSEPGAWKSVTHELYQSHVTVIYEVSLLRLNLSSQHSKWLHLGDFKSKIICSPTTGTDSEHGSLHH